MAEIGKYNHLPILRETNSGFYLDADNLGEILLPGKYLPTGAQIGDSIEVFVYRDSEDRLVATTEDAYCEAGDFVLLEVVEVNKIGAFLNWGLQKDLLVPFSGQKTKMEVGSWHIVYVYVDEKTGRIVASAKVEKFLNKQSAPYKAGEEVELFVYMHTPMGYKVIINQAHWGMLYENEVFQPLSKGERIQGYISQLREGGKIDVRLYAPGYGKTEGATALILKYLEMNNGILRLTDKSPAEKIYETFGISKKNFKMAIGNLYKQRKITIEKDCIRSEVED